MNRNRWSRWQRWSGTSRFIEDDPGAWLAVFQRIDGTFEWSFCRVVKSLDRAKPYRVVAEGVSISYQQARTDAEDAYSKATAAA